MRTTTTARRALALAAVLAGLVLTGCGSANPGSGTDAAMGNGSGPGMMGWAGYGYSKLSCSIPGNLPGRTVTVMFGDKGMTRMMGGTAPLGGRMMLHAAPTKFAAGKVTLVATNMGWRTHELVVLPLAAGQMAGQKVPGSDGKVDEVGSLAEASTNCGPGTGDGIRAGSAGWTTLTLAPGRYELICNLRNHYANGMHQAIVVT